MWLLRPFGLLRKIVRMYVLSHVEHREGLRIGKNSCWHRGCYINAVGGVSIGENVIIGPYCVLHSANHCFADLGKPVMLQGHIPESVHIGGDCWIGAHVVILPGVVLGRGCVVGAGAVVTKSFPAFSILAGVPAKIIGSRRKCQFLNDCLQYAEMTTDNSALDCESCDCRV